MPNPTRSQVHINKPLTNISVAHVQNATNFVAARAFPNVPVSFQSDQFYRYPSGYFNRDEMRKRAPATESAGGGFDIDTGTYSADVLAFHKDIADQIRANADAQINLERDAVQYLTLKGLLAREKAWANGFFQTGQWTTDMGGVAATPGAGEVLQWNDANSTPIEDIADAKSTILSLTGFEPNTLVLGYPVWQSLKNHPDIVDRIKYSGGVGPASPALVSQEAVAALFEVDRVLVMKAVENTADEGATASNAFIGGRKALLTYSAPNAGLMTPSAGYTFSWSGYTGAGPDGQVISRFRMEHLKADRIEIEMAFDMRVVSADMGVFFNDVVAA